MLKPFDQLLQEELESYQGEYASLVKLAPALYRLLTHVLNDPLLPGRLRPLLLAAIAYFILPADIISEDLAGPTGLLDDIFLSAFIANQVRLELKNDEILVSNWDGDRPLLPLLEEILRREAELIGGNRDLILWYLGYEYLIL